MSTEPNSRPQLFIFGLGFSGLAIARLALKRGWHVSGSVRTEQKAARLRQWLPSLDVIALDQAHDESASGGASAGSGGSNSSSDVGQRDSVVEKLTQRIDSATHVLMTAPTLAQQDGSHVDPLLSQVGAKHFGNKPWLGYMSTTVVYGDWAGAWVDEHSDTRTTSIRGRRRLEAEAQWRALASPTHIFRLAGIYGPGRNALETVRKGRARIIDKPGQVFSRIHVEDIAQTVMASLVRSTESPSDIADDVGNSSDGLGSGGEIFNLCDDAPCEPGEVIAFACALLGQAPPTPISLAEANLSPMGLSFYQDNKRVSNKKIKKLIGGNLRYPSYREGLTREFQRLDASASV